MHHLVKKLTIFFLFSFLFSFLISTTSKAENIYTDEKVEITGAEAMAISQSLKAIANEFIKGSSTKCDGNGICNLMVYSFEYHASLTSIWILSNDSSYETELLISLSSPVFNDAQKIARVFLNLGYKLDKYGRLKLNKMTCSSHKHSCEATIDIHK